MAEIEGRPGEFFHISKLALDLPSIRPGSLKAYVVAVVLTLAAAIVRLELLPGVDVAPFLTLFPAAVMVTLFCGGVAGALSTGLGLVLAWIFFIPHELTFGNAYRSAIFAIGTGTVILVAGAIRRTSSVIRDLNATLSHSEAKFRQLLESAPDAMVIADDAGRVVLVNAATERLFAYDRRDLLGQPVETLMQIDDDTQSFGRRRDGGVFPVEISDAPLRTIRDITARLQIEAELKRANRAKSEFLSAMSHELRTPLNAVVGFAELLQMKGADQLTEKQTEYVGHILEGGNHLLVLVTQLLDLAGIEAGRLNLTMGPVEVRLVLDYVYRLMRPIAEKAGVNFRLESPGGFHDVVADELRLRQVLLNFLSNAIKYNHAGGDVTLSALVEDGVVRFAVADTGVGIPDDRKDELFQPFHRLGAEHTSVGGTGIGLALSRRIVEAMNGAVGFTSEVGKGSTFWVDLPVVPGAAS
jgi:signal transduction histidine kinase